MNLIFKKLSAKTLTNEKATYNFFELKDYIDFDVRRMYYIVDIHADTGQHCHKIEKELFVMQRGNCIAVIDRGHGKEDVALSSGDAVYIGNYVWHGFKNFSEDAILLALSSTNYSPDRSDYVENYEQYLSLIK